MFVYIEIESSRIFSFRKFNVKWKEGRRTDWQDYTKKWRLIDFILRQPVDGNIWKLNKATWVVARLIWAVWNLSTSRNVRSLRGIVEAAFSRRGHVRTWKNSRARNSFTMILEQKNRPKKSWSQKIPKNSKKIPSGKILEPKIYLKKILERKIGSKKNREAWKSPKIRRKFPSRKILKPKIHPKNSRAKNSIGKKSWGLKIPINSKKILYEKFLKPKILPKKKKKKKKR